MNMFKEIGMVTDMERDMLAIQLITRHCCRAFKGFEQEDLSVHSIRIASDKRIAHVVGLMHMEHLDCLLNNLRINNRTISCNQLVRQQNHAQQHQ